MKRLTIKKLEVGSVAKFVGIVNALIAVVVGLIGSIGGIITLIAENNQTGLEAFGISVAVIAGGLILYPLLMFIFGWLYGALMALIFNLFVGVSGGITIDVEEQK